MIHVDLCQWCESLIERHLVARLHHFLILCSKLLLIWTFLFTLSKVEECALSVFVDFGRHKIFYILFDNNMRSITLVSPKLKHFTVDWRIFSKFWRLLLGVKVKQLSSILLLVVRYRIEALGSSLPAAMQSKNLIIFKFFVRLCFTVALFTCWVHLKDITGFPAYHILQISLAVWLICLDFKRWLWFLVLRERLLHVT